MERENTSNKIIEYQKELATLISRHATVEGKQHTTLPDLQLLRTSNVSQPLHSIYSPSLIVIAQGAKIVTLGDEVYQYDANSYIITSVDLPIIGRIVDATSQKPFLSVQISFRTDQIWDILKETDNILTGKMASERGLVVNKTNIDLLDAVLRLVRLLDTPEDIHILAPLTKSEILYRILQNDHRNVIKQFAIKGSHSYSIGQIIKLINDEFDRPLRIEELALKLNMSASSLHSHFKRVTGMSPLQYQKTIRLQEARRLLLTDSSLDAASVGFKVGYESPSQFSREYTRMFGLPPISDVKQLKNSLSINLSLI